MLEGRDHLADGGIHEGDLARHAGGRITRSVRIATKNFRAVNLLDELLADADRLEVHAKDYGNGLFAGAEVVFAVDPVHHRVDLELVVAFDGIEVGGPVAAGVSGNMGTIRTVGSLEVRNVDHVGIYFRSIVIVHVGGAIRSRRTRDHGVHGVLVRPRCETARGVNYAINRVGADEVPRVNRFAAIERVALQLVGINGQYPAIEHRVGTASIHLGLVDFDALFVLGLRSVNLPLDTVSTRQSVAGGRLGRRQDAIVRYVVKRAYRPGCPASDQGHEAREGVGRPGSRSTGVVYARLAESGECGARVPSHTVFVVDRVHSIDTDEQHMAIAVVVIGVVPVLRAGDRSKRDSRSKKKRAWLGQQLGKHKNSSHGL